MAQWLCHRNLKAGASYIFRSPPQQIGKAAQCSSPLKYILNERNVLFHTFFHILMRTECVFVKIVFKNQTQKITLNNTDPSESKPSHSRWHKTKAVCITLNCATHTESCTCLECYTSFSLANLTRSRSNVANPLEPHLHLICEAWRITAGQARRRAKKWC